MEEKQKIKCSLCNDHFERLVRGNVCESCPSIPEHEAVIRFMSEQLNQAATDDTGMIRAIWTEVRSIRTLCTDFHTRIEECEHTIHGNGNPGLKTQMAVLESQSNENKHRPMMIVSIGTGIGAVLVALMALFK